MSETTVEVVDATVSVTIGNETVTVEVQDASVTVDVAELIENQYVHPDSHTASEISDFDAEVSNNVDVAANTAHRAADAPHSGHAAAVHSHPDLPLAGGTMDAGAEITFADETKINSGAADSTAAIAHILNTANNLSTEGYKLLELQNNDVMYGYMRGTVKGGVFDNTGRHLVIGIPDTGNLLNVGFNTELYNEVTIENIGSTGGKFNLTTPIGGLFSITPATGLISTSASQLNFNNWLTVTANKFTPALGGSTALGDPSHVFGTSYQTVINLTHAQNANIAGGNIIASSMTDNAASVSLTTNCLTEMVTLGALLLSVRNAGVEKFSVDKDGLINLQGQTTGTVTTETVAASGEYITIEVGGVSKKIALMA